MNTDTRETRVQVNQQARTTHGGTYGTEKARADVRIADAIGPRTTVARQAIAQSQSMATQNLGSWAAKFQLTFLYMSIKEVK